MNKNVESLYVLFQSWGTGLCIALIHITMEALGRRKHTRNALFQSCGKSAKCKLRL